jgi:hypothetical protein
MFEGRKMQKTLLLVFLFVLMSCLSVLGESPNGRHGDDLCFAYRSFWPEFEAMKEFKQNLHADTICIFPANTVNTLGEPYCKYPCHWVWFGKYEFEHLDKQFDDVLAVNPDAKFLCMIDVNTPLWLSRRRAMGRLAFDSFADLSNCAADPTWQQQVLDYVEAFVKHTEEKYGNKIRAYIPAGGQSSEWIDLAGGRTSYAKSKAFLEWAEKNNKSQPLSVVPCERLEKPSFEFLFDPSTDGDVIDYVRFQGDIIVDIALKVVRKIRTLVPKDREIGMFFGQVVGDNSPGHLECERLFADPDIDFFISPGWYADRKMGGGSGAVVPLGTLRRYGKSYLHEIDHRTYTSNSVLSNSVSMDFASVHVEKWEDAAAVDAGLKRETAFALVNHSSLWMFDMWGGYYTASATQETLKTVKKAWDRLAADRSESVAEIALVIDLQSRRYAAHKKMWDYWDYFKTPYKLNRIGVPFDVYSFNDIGSVDFSRYKLVILPETFEITTEREAVLRKHILNNDRTVLWMYAPGVIDGKDLQTERVKKWTGVEYGTSGVNTVKHDGWTSVYVHKYTTLTPKNLREIASASGVHFYVDKAVPVYANRRLVVVHTAEGGTWKVKLPRPCRQVIDVFSEKTVAENVSEFMYTFKSPDTVLFETIGNEEK